jgi:hypothetical protein
MLSLPRSLLSILAAVKRWIRESSVRVAFAFGILFATYFLFVEIGAWNLASDLATIRAAAASFIVGVFIATVFITMRMRNPLESTLARVLAGVIAGPLVAVVLGASLLVAFGAAVFGACLAYFGPRWVNHV